MLQQDQDLCLEQLITCVSGLVIYIMFMEMLQVLLIGNGTFGNDGSTDI